MAADEILIRYVADYSQIEAENAKIEQQFEEIEADGKKAFDTAGTAAAANAPRVTKFGQSVAGADKNIQGLRTSVNQISRELPAFTMNLNTGFLAISNNLPMLADSINKIKAANADLAAQGQKTQSVLGAIGAAVFSWQTALSVGITLLTAYGSKIVDFITGTNTAVASQKEFEKHQKKVNDEMQAQLIMQDQLNDEYERGARAVLLYYREMNNNSVKGSNVMKRELEIMKAKGLTEEELFVKEQQIRRVQLQELTYVMNQLTEFGDNQLKLAAEIADKETEIKAKQIEHDLGKKKDEEDWLVSLYKRQKKLLEAQGEETYEISKKIINREIQLLEAGTKEWLDKKNDLLVLDAERDRKLREERERRIKEENEARIRTEQMNLETEAKAAHERYQRAVKAVEDTKKQSSEKLDLLLRDMDAESRIRLAGTDDFYEQQEVRKQMLENAFQRELALRSLTAKEIEALEAEKNKNIENLDKQSYEKRIDDAIQYADAVGAVLSGIIRIQTIEAQNQLRERQKQDEKEKERIEQNFKADLITKEQRDQQLAALDKQSEEAQNKIRNEQAEKERQLAIFLATIKSILATIEATLNPTKIPQAILANAELGILLATPTPKFKDGVVDLQGPGTETSDSIVARLSKGESVVHAKGTKSYKDHLVAMNSHDPLKYEKLIEQKYVQPAIEEERKKQADFAENLAKSVALHSAFNDTNIVKAIEKGRKENSRDIKTMSEVVAKQTRLSLFRGKIIGTK